MFDGLQGADALVRADDATVVAAIAEWTRAEAAASSRRLAAIAELVRRHAMGPVDHAMWSCDNWDAIAAEVSAAQGISHGMASGQMYLAVALRDRLPRVAAVFADGAISARLAAAIVWHTDLIKDAGTLQLVDTALAENAVRYGRLSVSKTAQAIDAIVDRHDPGALRRSQAAARSRDVVIDLANDESGTAALWGRLYSTDAAALDRRLLQMAHDVFDDDPRTLAQRRADALGALAAGAERLSCGCDNAECPKRLASDERATSVVIHVVADASALESRPDAPETSSTGRPSALIAGGGTVPAPRLADLIRTGAQVRPVRHPGGASAGEPGYRPSAALDAFVRCRDLTCRFPHCDRPAECCDVDHTIPHPFGPTHPSNLKCLCRKHHLLKTFWTAWRDEQRPDGTVVWTSPSGHTYTTRPGSRLLFPTLCMPTGELPTPPRVDHRSDGRGIMMPKRWRTREHDRIYRINAERSLNAAHVAERNQPPPF
ncbi:HNH endonuclease signature motif containing protein [Mycobacterium stomatepiae]|uniref:HNH nuclease domain-containing protein n=1 Tax=Mycobacterium stomatepiae TaxID=470076 RepID=A0A7I7Q2A3_9MYCO|nr:HNH endonuclease signature motif containing protein [Mycobacterium stomatepiae]MCV7166462.1 DUF222 domain-containing protein [Mycobacterium stomatepiae]BBY20137.1 hypothetical protein MSTO_03420 [Mycobacterium stomatepiae]